MSEERRLELDFPAQHGGGVPLRKHHLGPAGAHPATPVRPRLRSQGRGGLGGAQAACEPALLATGMGSQAPVGPLKQQKRSGEQAGLGGDS